MLQAFAPPSCDRFFFRGCLGEGLHRDKINIPPADVLVRAILEAAGTGHAVGAVGFVIRAGPLEGELDELEPGDEADKGTEEPSPGDISFFHRQGFIEQLLRRAAGLAEGFDRVVSLLELTCLREKDLFGEIDLRVQQRDGAAEPGAQPPTQYDAHRQQQEQTAKPGAPNWPGLAAFGWGRVMNGGKRARFFAEPALNALIRRDGDVPFRDL